jgi:hypothetical protein
MASGSSVMTGDARVGKINYGQVKLSETLADY